jgi:asparagine synthetase B (glutamine-hydrolysing)
MRTLLEDFDDFIFHHDEPPGSLSQYAAWSVMRLARQHHVPVLLNGQGGDELFFWVSGVLPVPPAAIGPSALSCGQTRVRGAVA